jgi:Divergent InlB B-repeat domain
MRHAGGWIARAVTALIALTSLGACGDGQGGLQLGDNFVATLDVSIEGTGSGRVAAQGLNPRPEYFGGFTCDTEAGSCEDQEDLDVDGADSVRLVAVPAAGSLLAGWSGDCTVSAAPDTAYIYMDTERRYNCTATFDLDPLANACTNAVVIQDDFSSDAGWTTSLTANNGNVTQAVAVQASGGIPGGYRRMQHIFTGASLMAVFHAYGAVTYNPSTQGVIDHINYSEDQIVIDPPFVGAAVGTGFTMTQGGIRYSIVMNPPGAAFTNLAWQKSSRVDLTAADFPGIDFSAAGGPITFGYFRSNSNDGGGAITVTHGIDNFRVEVCR